MLVLSVYYEHPYWETGREEKGEAGREGADREWYGGRERGESRENLI